MDQNLSSGNIASKSDSIKGDEIADKEENAGQNEINEDENGQEGQLQDIDTAPDSAYQTENDTDTLQERSEVLHWMTQRKIPILMLKRKNRRIVK